MHLNTFTVYKVTLVLKSCNDEIQNISLLYQNYISHNKNQYYSFYLNRNSIRTTPL